MLRAISHLTILVDVHQPFLSEDEKLKNQILAQEFFNWFKNDAKLIDIL
jgi:hypothetical protein